MAETESIIEKAGRLLVEGRLTVERVEGDLVVASCRGDNGTYRLGYDPGAKEFRCTCPARKRCAHVQALMLVTLRWSEDG